ncbi:MAG TPA: M66 family metalloprotease [Polyangiaceae bacterium]|nr:M66 family metalloprotease [Polyangiaceae bacterium]
MQSNRNFRASLLWILLSGLGCTGVVEPQGGSGQAPGGADLMGPVAGSGPSLPGGMSGSAGSAGSAPIMPELPVWPGTVGSWCGPGDNATVWLVARPQASACQASSTKVYTTEMMMEDATEGLKLQLDPMQLTTFPAQLSVPARYCAPVSGCSDVTVALKVESYTQGQGVTGTWAFTPLGQASLEGRLQASWCNWDDFLPAHPDGQRLARDIQIQEVAVYQGVKVPIVRDMMPIANRNADLVQQREAMVRIFVRPGPSFQSRELSARITLQDGEVTRRFEETITVSGGSTDADGQSTFNIELPKDAFKEGTQYSVELRETTKCTPLMGTPVGARFPETGLSPVGARLTGPVKVLLVPVRYDADGSGRMPDTSAEQLEQMTARLYSMYPTSEVTIKLRDPVGTTATDLGDMLDQMRALRDTDAPPSDLSYYGMVRHAETFREYCGGGCTTGIAGFGSQSGISTAGMGIGYLNQAAGTFVHELGHIYRRPHSPCGGAAGSDPDYPYPEAALGSWGYDVRTKELYDPGETVDFMSYCSPDWISDYNYQLLLERVVVVNERARMRVVRAPGAPSVYRTLIVSENGQTRWGLDLRPRLAPPGDPLKVRVLDAQGGLLTQVSAYQELMENGERAIFVPAPQAGWHSVQAPGALAAPFSLKTRNKPFTR